METKKTCECACGQAGLSVTWNKLLMTSIAQFSLAIIWPLISYFGVRGFVNPRWPMAVIDSITILAPMVVLLWTWISYWQYVRSLARKEEATGEEAAKADAPMMQRLEMELAMLRLRVIRGLCMTWSFNIVVLSLSVLLRLVIAEVAG